MRSQSNSNSSSEERESNVYTAKGKQQDLVRVIHKPKSDSSSSGSREKERNYKPAFKRQKELAKRKPSKSGSPKIGLQNQRGRQLPLKNKQIESKKNVQNQNEKTAAFIERMRPKPLEK